MVDNRAAGFYGIGGSFNFRSGDISGTAAGLSDDKMGQGNEYSRQDKSEESSTQESKMQFTDRSAQLRATLNSLAMINVAGVINAKKRPSLIDEDKEEKFDDKEFYKNLNKRKKELLLENELLEDDSDSQGFENKDDDEDEDENDEEESESNRLRELVLV